MISDTEKQVGGNHYTAIGSVCPCGRSIQPIDISERLTANLAKALEYVARADFKGEFERDLKKAIWHINRELRLREIKRLQERRKQEGG